MLVSFINWLIDLLPTYSEEYLEKKSEDAKSESEAGKNHMGSPRAGAYCNHYD